VSDPRARHVRDFRRIRRLALAAARQCEHYERIVAAKDHAVDPEAYEEMCRALLASAKLREAMAIAERIMRRAKETRRWGLPIEEEARRVWAPHHLHRRFRARHSCGSEDADAAGGPAAASSRAGRIRRRCPREERG
jgi:hypothetical protein